MGTGVFPGGKERPGRDADPSPPSTAVSHERVKLYLYSPYGPYGLYKGDLYLLYSKNTHFIINYVLKLKYQPGHLKLKANVV
jgi:hypothetical protein